MNTKKLKMKIIDSGIKYKVIAKNLGLSYYGLQKKVNNETEFKASEIKKLCKMLNITDSKIKEEIFFEGM
jgi:cytidylate kinase